MVPVFIIGRGRPIHRFPPIATIDPADPGGSFALFDLIQEAQIPCWGGVAGWATWLPSVP